MSQCKDLPRPTIGLAQLLSDCGVRAASAIRVTGPGSLPALLWLCRRGYANVGCAQAGRKAPGDAADALLAAHTASGEWLADLLDHGPHVRPGGVMIVQTRPALGGGAAARLFHSHGFDLVRRLPGAHRDVLVARRAVGGLQQAA
jgi:hypothetical protein